MRPSGKAIAQALGVSESRVSQLKRDGMPVDDIAAALAWYRRRVDTGRSFGQRHRAGRAQPEPPPDAPASSGADLAQLRRLGDLAGRQLEAGHPLGVLADDLRAALRAVLCSESPATWPEIKLPAAVWTELMAEFLALVHDIETEGVHDPEALNEAADDEANETMVLFAAGLLVVANPESAATATSNLDPKGGFPNE